MQYALKIEYQHVTAFLAALSMGNTMTQTMTDIATSAPSDHPEVIKQRELIDRAVVASKRQAQRCEAITQVFRAAMGKANIFPEFHPLASKPEDIITLDLTEESIVEIIDVTRGVSVALNGMVSMNKTRSFFGQKGLDIVFILPRDTLRKSVIPFIRAVLDCGCPIF